MSIRPSVLFAILLAVVFVLSLAALILLSMEPDGLVRSISESTEAAKQEW